MGNSKAVVPPGNVILMKALGPERKPANSEFFWRNAPSKLWRIHAT